MTRKDMDRTHYRLYLHDPSGPRSQHTVDAVRNVCTGLHGSLDRFEVVYLNREPARAAQAGVWATPMLERVSPMPERRFFGDLSNVHRLNSLLQPTPLTLDQHPGD